MVHRLSPRGGVTRSSRSPTSETRHPRPTSETWFPLGLTVRQDQGRPRIPPSYVVSVVPECGVQSLSVIYRSLYPSYTPLRPSRGQMSSEGREGWEKGGVDVSVGTHRPREDSLGPRPAGPPRTPTGWPLGLTLAAGHLVGVRVGTLGLRQSVVFPVPTSPTQKRWRPVLRPKKFPTGGGNMYTHPRRRRGRL